MKAGHHRCPRRTCNRIVPDHLFACRNDWYALPANIRAEIWATVGLPLTDEARRDVVLAAVEFLNPGPLTP